MSRPEVVVDVGNTALKWGRVTPFGIDPAVAYLPVDEAAWTAQAVAWGQPNRYLVAGVHPERIARFHRWAGDKSQLFDRVPLAIDVEQPERVGMDRLLDALAAWKRSPQGAITVDAGSAVTVDVIDHTGTFRGGVILPGLRLMSLALHEHTAKLPLLTWQNLTRPDVPGRSTESAMRQGILHAVAGGIEKLVVAYRAQFGALPIYVTGGDGPALLDGWLSFDDVHAVPTLTLEGMLASVSE